MKPIVQTLHKQDIVHLRNGFHIKVKVTYHKFTVYCKIHCIYTLLYFLNVGLNAFI